MVQKSPKKAQLKKEKRTDTPKSPENSKEDNFCYDKMSAPSEGRIKSVRRALERDGCALVDNDIRRLTSSKKPELAEIVAFSLHDIKRDRSENAKPNLITAIPLLRRIYDTNIPFFKRVARVPTAIVNTTFRKGEAVGPYLEYMLEASQIGENIEERVVFSGIPKNLFLENFRRHEKYAEYKAVKERVSKHFGDIRLLEVKERKALIPVLKYIDEERRLDSLQRAIPYTHMVDGALDLVRRHGDNLEGAIEDQDAYTSSLKYLFNASATKKAQRKLEGIIPLVKEVVFQEPQLLNERIKQDAYLARIVNNEVIGAPYLQSALHVAKTDKDISRKLDYLEIAEGMYDEYCSVHLIEDTQRRVSKYITEIDSSKNGKKMIDLMKKTKNKLRENISLRAVPYEHFLREVLETDKREEDSDRKDARQEYVSLLSVTDYYSKRAPGKLAKNIAENFDIVKKIVHNNSDLLKKRVSKETSLYGIFDKASNIKPYLETILKISNIEGPEEHLKYFMELTDNIFREYSSSKQKTASRKTKEKCNTLIDRLSEFSEDERTQVISLLSFSQKKLRRHTTSANKEKNFFVDDLAKYVIDSYQNNPQDAFYFIAQLVDNRRTG